MSTEADIVERLRERSLELSGRSIDRGCQDSGISANLCDEAVDLITKLGAERDAAVQEVSVLRQIVHDMTDGITANMAEAEHQAVAMAAARNMRERAAMAVRNRICTISWPPEDGDELIDTLMAVVRALPDRHPLIATEGDGS